MTKWSVLTSIHNKAYISFVYTYTIKQAKHSIGKTFGVGKDDFKSTGMSPDTLQ